MDYPKSQTKTADAEARLAQLELLVQTQWDAALAILAKLDSAESVQELKELFRRFLGTYLQGQKP